MFEIEGSKCPICGDGILKRDTFSKGYILMSQDLKSFKKNALVEPYICNNCGFTALKKIKDM